MESASYEIRLKDAFSQGLGRIESRMDRFESKIGGLQTQTSSFGSSFAAAFAGGAVVGAVTQGISMLKDFGFEVINVARNFTNMKDAIEFASGSHATQNI